MNFKFQMSPFDPCLYFIFRGNCGAVGAIAAQIEDIHVCGVPDVSSKLRGLSDRRFRDLKLRGKSSAHVGTEASQANDLSAGLTQEFTKGLRPFPTPPHFWAARPRPLSSDEIKIC